MTEPRLTIAVDWSARSAPSPKRPSPDAIWIAHNAAGIDHPPEYVRTRDDATHRIIELLRAHSGPALVGFDFPLGYPLATDGSPVMPIGRDLCAHVAQLVDDKPDNRNNRFDVAEQLNAEIATRFGEPHGPFWGCPSNRDTSPGLLLPTKRVMRSVPEYRAVERHIRDTRKLGIQSAWKLYTTGSVGSQALLGLPAIHRIITEPPLADRCWLWPFDAEPNRDDAIAIAEIWPTLTPCDHVEHGIKDARQVVAVRDAFATRGLFDPASEAREGWIVGADAPLTPSPPDAAATPHR